MQSLASSPETLEIKEEQRLDTLPLGLVEVRRIELLSESTSAHLSPSAASDLELRIGKRPKAGYSVNYPFSSVMLKGVGITFSCMNDARISACR